MLRRRGALAATAMALTIAACGGDSVVTRDAGAPERLAERLAVLEAHVTDWQAAATLEEAYAAAEAAANHVTGPDGPGFGDRDGDGEVRGPSDAGILPGVDGDPAGFALLAVEGGAPPCVDRDVLGGSWSDPRERWDVLAEAVAAWRPDNNTYPSLPSHPQRVVGWALLTLATDSLETAHEYAGHARLHVAISQRALDC